eukprot:scaffold16780_cov63-Phaeocystis_antarctica.AAC.5
MPCIWHHTTPLSILLAPARLSKDLLEFNRDAYETHLSKHAKKVHMGTSGDFDLPTTPLLRCMTLARSYPGRGVWSAQMLTCCQQGAFGDGGPA